MTLDFWLYNSNFQSASVQCVTSVLIIDLSLFLTVQWATCDSSSIFLSTKWRKHDYFCVDIKTIVLICLREYKQFSYDLDIFIFEIRVNSESPLLLVEIHSPKQANQTIVCFRRIRLINFAQTSKFNWTLIIS